MVFSEGTSAGLSTNSPAWSRDPDEELAWLRRSLEALAAVLTMRQLALSAFVSIGS